MNLLTAIIVMLLLMDVIFVYMWLIHKKNKELQIDNYISEIYDLQQENIKLQSILNKINCKNLEANNKYSNIGSNSYTNGYSDELVD